MSCPVVNMPIPDWSGCPEPRQRVPFYFIGKITEVRRIRGRFEIDILSGERKNTVSGNGDAKGVWAGQIAEVSSDENGRITIKNISE